MRRKKRKPSNLQWATEIAFGASIAIIYNRIIDQRARVRNAPPNGVMPIATDPNLSIR